MKKLFTIGLVWSMFQLTIFTFLLVPPLVIIPYITGQDTAWDLFLYLGTWVMGAYIFGRFIPQVDRVMVCVWFCPIGIWWLFNFNVIFLIVLFFLWFRYISWMNKTMDAY